MAKKIPALIQLSTSELKRMLAARERIDVLEAEKARLLKGLAAVDRELAQLLAGAAPAAAGRPRKAGRKPAPKKPRATARKAAGATAKKTARKTKCQEEGRKKKAAKKKVAKKTARKAGRKKVAKKIAKKTAGRPVARAAAGRVRLEDVILAVLRKSKKPVTFKKLYATIVDGKLFATKSANFDNVLRRTLSTSDAVARVGRGLYAVA